MKESYKLIETLRKEITGEETTFKIAFDVGGTKKGHVYELKLSLSEILDSKLNFTHLSFASSSKVGNATSTMKLRFQEFKAADKRALYKKYSSQMGTKLFDISSEYKNFQKQTTELGLTLSPGRQYEFFKKAQAIQRYDKSTLSKLRDSVITDRLPFTEGVDFAYKDNSGYHFESLKSIIGKSPSLASFTTLLSTLQKVSSTMDQLVNNPMALEEYINFKMQEQQQGISKAAEQSIEESIGSQVVKPMLDQIFPQMTGIFDLSST